VVRGSGTPLWLVRLAVRNDQGQRLGVGRRYRCRPLGSAFQRAAHHPDTNLDRVKRGENHSDGGRSNGSERDGSDVRLIRGWCEGRLTHHASSWTQVDLYRAPGLLAGLLIDTP